VFSGGGRGGHGMCQKQRAQQYRWDAPPPQMQTALHQN